MKNFISLFFLFSFGFTSAQTDLQNIRFRHLTIEDGLPDNNVRAILQDKTGFMWFGTFNGLVLYDGYSFKTYFDSTIFSDHSVNCMVEDNEGLIWSGSRRNGLSVLNPITGKFRHYTYNKNDTTSLNFYDVTSLCKDKDGDVWVGTRAGLNKYDRKNDCFIRYEKFPGSPGTLFDIYVDKNNLLWLSSHYNGLNSFDKKTEKFTLYSIAPQDIGNPKMSVFEDSSGIMYVGTRGGLDVLNTPDKKLIKTYHHDSNDPTTLSGDDMMVSKTFVDSRNIVWIGTWHDGLNVFDRDKEQFIRYQHNVNFSASISHNAIRCIYEDRAGFIWIGTEGGGINIYNPSNSLFTVHQAIANTVGTLSSNEISAVYEDSKERLWVGTSSDGINLFDTQKNKFIIYKNNPSDKNSLGYNNVPSICEDNNGMIWIANIFATLPSIFNPKTNHFNSLPMSIENILYKDSKGLLWFGGHGAHAYDSKTKKVIEFDSTLPDSIKKSLRYIGVIYEDKANNIWLGSSIYGLNFYNRKTGNFINYKATSFDTESISHDIISALIQDKNGIMWIGTIYGLNSFDTSTKKFKHYFIKDGLPDNSISSILEDKEGNLWVATGKGLCKFNPEETSFRTYDVTDGLPSNEFSGASFKGKDGKFYLGTTNGLVSFYPEQIKNNPHKPKVVITKFTVMNKPWALPQEISFTTELTLSYHEYFFSLEFAALDFSAPEKNQYAYKLEGFNKDWVYLNNKREVTFTNLNAGEYILKTKGSNNSGIWSDETTLLKIIITPPWWKTKIFYTICLVLLILLIYGYIKWRERQLQAEKKILENKVEVATFEIRKQKQVIEEKNKDITDSINYALRIQQAFLPEKEEIYLSFPQSFILFKPKDIVSGDFYFFKEKKVENLKNREIEMEKNAPQNSPTLQLSNSKIIFIAAVDCTGHGVPGAFMSVVGSERLTDAVQQSNNTSEILSLLNTGVRNSLHQSSKEESTRDGMDIALVSVEFGELPTKLNYAGANRPIWIIRKGQTEIEEIKATKKAIGGLTENNQHFDTHELKLNEGDSFYIFSDGYADLFGSNGKKLTTKKMKDILIGIQNKSMQEQEKYLDTFAENWKANSEQIDDILIIGIRV